MIIAAVDWADIHNEKLKKSAGDDLAFVRDQVRRGVAVLWRCESDRGGGFAVTRIDGPELVIVLGEGSAAAVFIPHFIKYAKQKGLGIRTHVKRRGLIRIYERFGLGVSEYVLRG